jgi:hypothetical protein
VALGLELNQKFLKNLSSSGIFYCLILSKDVEELNLDSAD